MAEKTESDFWDNISHFFSYNSQKENKGLSRTADLASGLAGKKIGKAGKVPGKIAGNINLGLTIIDCLQTYQEDKVYGVKKEVTMQKIAYKSAKFGIESTLDAMAADLAVAFLTGSALEAPSPYTLLFGLVAYDVFQLAACAIVAHEIVETLGDDPDNWDEFFWPGNHIFEKMDENAVRTAKWQAEGVLSKQQGEYELAKLIYHVSKEFGYHAAETQYNLNMEYSRIQMEGGRELAKDIKNGVNNYVEDTARRNFDDAKLHYEASQAMARVLEQAFHVTKEKAAQGSREAYDDIKKLYDKALVFFSRLVADTKAKGKKIYFNFEQDFKQTLLNHKPVGSVEQLYLSLEPDIREFVDKHFFYDYNGNITSFGHEHNEHYMNVMRSVEPVFPTDIFDFREIPDEKLEVNSNSEIKGFLFLLQQEAGNINYSPSEQHYILDGYYQFIDYSKTHLDFKSRKKELEDILHEVKNKLIDYKNFAY